MQQVRGYAIKAIIVTTVLLIAMSGAALAQGQLRGSAQGPDGKPLAGVEIKMVPSDEAFSTLTTTTNKKGKFVFGLIRPSDYRLVAFAEGMRISRVDANIALPDDDSLWAVHEDLPQGAELPEFSVSGLAKVTYDLQFVVHDGEPGAYGTGLPVSPTKVIIDLISEGKLDEAVVEIERNLKNDPESATYNYLMGFALYSDSKPDEALAAVDRALETDPAFEGGNLLKGSILDSQGKVEESVEFFEVEADSAGSMQVQRDALLGMAVAYVKLEKLEEAAETLERLIEVAPDHVGAYKELADIYLRLGNTERAQELMDDVADLGAQDPRLMYNIGAERFNASDFEGAAEYFKGSIAADPEFKDAYLRLAYTQLNLGDKPGAIKSLEKFLELSSEETQEVQTARAILQQLSAQQ